jgi:hypothetical protein
MWSWTRCTLSKRPVHFVFSKVLVVPGSRRRSRASSGPIKCTDCMRFVYSVLALSTPRYSYTTSSSSPCWLKSNPPSTCDLHMSRSSSQSSPTYMLQTGHVLRAFFCTVDVDNVESYKYMGGGGGGMKLWVPMPFRGIWFWQNQQGLLYTLLYIRECIDPCWF